MKKASQEKIHTVKQKQNAVSFKNNKSIKDTFAPYQGKAIYNSPVTEPETEEWGESA